MTKSVGRKDTAERTASTKTGVTRGATMQRAGGKSADARGQGTKTPRAGGANAGNAADAESADAKGVAAKVIPPEETPHEDYSSAAGLFRALSHPLRVQLVCGLLQEPISQTGIARLLGLSQSLVAQHLAVLRRAGLVRGHREHGEVVLEVIDSRLPAIFAAVCGDAERFLSAGWEEVSRRRAEEQKEP